MPNCDGRVVHSGNKTLCESGKAPVRPQSQTSAKSLTELVGGEPTTQLEEGTFYYPVPPTDGAFPLAANPQVPGILHGLFGLKTLTGTVTITITIDGTPVEGWDEVEVTTVPQDLPAVAHNVMNIGDRVEIEITSDGNATGLEFTMTFTHTS